MGRGKIEIKRIENSNNRQVTYSKRRNGIIKKAKEITVLCEAEVSLVIFASSGKIHEFCSPNTTVANILDKYHKQSGKKLWDAKQENLSNEIDRVKKENDNMQIELRHLKGEDIQSLQYRELIRLENALENGLSTVRDRQMEVYKAMKKNDQMLEDENRQLNYMLQQKMNIEGSCSSMRGMESASGYHQVDDRDYHNQIPFAPFRIQPMQPN